MLDACSKEFKDFSFYYYSFKPKIKNKTKQTKLQIHTHIYVWVSKNLTCGYSLSSLVILLQWTWVLIKY